MTATCTKCGGTTERGFTTAAGLLAGDGAEGQQARLLFVVMGVPTAGNPVRAFQQGLADEPGNRVYHLAGVRCSRCGLVELHAEGPGTRV